MSVPKADDADLEKLAEDWISLWQSEIAGLASDREAAESWSAAAARIQAAPPFGHSGAAVRDAA